MKRNTFNEEQIAQATNMLKAIAHPTRIKILEILKKGDKLTVTQIQQKLKSEQSTTSHHLSILKDKGVLCSYRNGKNIHYYIKHIILGQIIDCMQKCTCKEEKSE